MNDKNEPVIEFAKNFIDDCNNFEIKNLDSAKSEQNNSPDISLFSDFVKEYLNPIEEEQNQNLIKTGSNDLDELCIFEKDMFKLFCTDEFNVPLARMVNSFVIEAVAGGKRVLIISPYHNVVVRNFLKAIVRKDYKNNNSWFDDKKLYFYECMPDNNIIDLTEKLRVKIIDLNIDVLYIPYLEDLLRNYCADLQIDALKYFYNFAFDKKISIVSLHTKKKPSFLNFFSVFFKYYINYFKQLCQVFFICTYNSLSIYHNNYKTNIHIHKDNFCNILHYLFHH